MITKPTVLVLGAGASMPYGYPSGIGLLNGIRKRLSEAVKRFNDSVFFKLGFTAQETLDFERALYHCPLDSIDAFLEHRKEFIDLGKIVIGLELIECENQEKLFHYNVRDENEDWYSYLFKRMGSKASEFKDNQLSILTYNYDRSFEHFLVEGLQATFNLSDTELQTTHLLIPIVHLHGTIGNLPLFDPDARPYGKSKIEPEELRRFSEGIKIVHESNLGEGYDKAYDILDKAETICFLGFGYHEVNVTRLFKEHWNKNGKSFCGTSVGFTEVEKYRIIQQLNQYGCSEFGMDAKKYNNKVFLRETGVLENSSPYLKRRVRPNLKFIMRSVGRAKEEKSL